jgi:threonine dehydrogenase-like Zn-dependent dehydrogenase
MDKLKKFQKVDHDIPKKSLAWRIYGQGMENFGDDKKPVEITLPEPGDDEILVRNDAVGLCFSDTKIIKFGENHPRIQVQGRKLKKDPVIPGHEVSLTVVKAGKNRAKDFKPGERYLIQADVRYKGKSVAYGYNLPGGLSQYGIIGKEVIDGDDGSYLIPVKNLNTSYSEVGLVEPWACVVSSYRIEHRDGIKKDGNLLIVGNGEDGKDWQFENVFHQRLPKNIVCVNVARNTKEIVSQVVSANMAVMKDAGTVVHEESVVSMDEIPSIIKNSADKFTGGKGFDDIIILGDTEPQILVTAGDSMCQFGILNYMATSDDPQPVDIDAGKIHYDQISFVGGLKSDVNSPYIENLDYSLKGDSVILFGTGGPMGQMHIQLVMENPTPPKVVIATDIAEDRLNVLKESFEPLAKEKGIKYYALNPNDFSSPEAFREEIMKINNGKLFDYVVCLAAIPAVIEDAASYLGDRAILNIFAGVSKGTIAKLNVKETAAKSVRYIGSSGSSLSDMVYTLRRVEESGLNTNSAVAGVAGMNDVWNGIDAVRTGSFPGKIIIYPHIKKLDLISLKELKKKHPEIGKHLTGSGKWTKKAEDQLLEEMLDI